MTDRTLGLRGPEHLVELRAPLPFTWQLARALQLSRASAQGAISGTREAALGPIVCTWRGVRADPRRLAHYRVVCGHPNDGFLPPAWIETLFLGPIAAVVLSDAFPLSPLGMIGAGQRITVYRPVRSDESFDAIARLAAVRETSRGFEIDLALELRAGTEVPWTGLSTMLSRSKATRARIRRHEWQEPAADRAGDGWHTMVIDVPANEGRRYARASGDWSPHHLWPVTARLVGYRRPIAHVMWVLGRLLARLERRLAPPWTADARFMRPIYLPSRVAIRWRDEARSISFEASNATTGELHFCGSLWAFSPTGDPGLDCGWHERARPLRP